MNFELNLLHYAIGRWTIELGLLALVAWLVVRGRSSPHFRKAVWQTTLCGMLLIPTMEIGDWSARFRSQFTNEPAQKSSVTTQPRREFRAGTGVDRAYTTANSPQIDAQNPAVERKTNLSDNNRQWAIWIWLSGVGYFLMRAVSRRVGLLLRRRQACVASKSIMERVERLRRMLHLPVVTVQVWPELRSPVAFGIFRPTIAVPENFEEQFTDTQIEAMFTHELAHLSGKDPGWLGIADGVAALFWWHPMVWWVRRRMMIESEIVADSASALLTDGPSRLAEVLVKLGRETGIPKVVRGFSMAGPGFRSQLGRRVSALVEGEPGWRPMKRMNRIVLMGTAIVFALVMSGVPGPTGYSLGWTTLRAAIADDQVSAEISTGSSTTPDSPETDPMNPEVIQTNSIDADKIQQANPASQTLKVQVSFVEVLMGSADDSGIDWVFGRLPEENPPIITATFGEYGQVEELRNEDQVSVLSERQYAALMNRFANKSGIDVLAMPSIELRDGQQGQIAALDIRKLAGGVKLTADPNEKAARTVTYEISEFLAGPVLDIMARAERGGWTLIVTASVNEFIGYDDPSAATDPVVADRVRELQGIAVLPLPRVRTRKTDGMIWVQPGQTVALRGPSGIQSRETKEGFWIFKKTKFHEAERRVYVFVTAVP